MNNYVADTMAIVLYLENRKLPNDAKQIFNDVFENKSIVYISAVTLMEIGYLSEKLRIDTTISSVIQLTKNNTGFVLQQMDTKTVVEAFQINDIPELHDRLIAATANVLKAVLITNDPIIRQSEYVETLW